MILAKLQLFLLLILMEHFFNLNKYQRMFLYIEFQVVFLILYDDYQLKHHKLISHKISHKDFLILLMEYIQHNLISKKYLKLNYYFFFYLPGI